MADLSLYQPSSSQLHQLNPLTKLGLLALSLGAAFGFPSPFWVLGFYLVITLGLAAWGGLLRTFLIQNFKLILPFFLSLFFIQGFFYGGDQIVFQIGPFSYTLEGMQVAFNYTVRILQAIGGMTLFIFSTRPDHLMLAFQKLGLPHQALYLVVTTMQIIPQFQKKAQDILESQQARGLETQGGFYKRARALFPVVVPMILGSLIDIDERVIALESRAFSKQVPKTSLTRLEDSRIQKILRWSFLLLGLGLIIWRIV
jgi:energy-coupling factor transporter transmembrane protein EcfT